MLSKKFCILALFLNFFYLKAELPEPFNIDKILPINMFGWFGHENQKCIYPNLLMN